MGGRWWVVVVQTMFSVKLELKLNNYHIVDENSSIMMPVEGVRN